MNRFNLLLILIALGWTLVGVGLVSSVGLVFVGLSIGGSGMAGLWNQFELLELSKL